MSIKKKAIKGFSWTVFEGIFSQGAIFIVGIILARLLTPEDFGVVGIITAIITVTNSVVEAGFGSALIRKVDATEKDYNTVFYTNIITAVLLYLLLWAVANNIAAFFNTPILTNLIKVSGTILVINGLVIIQRTILTKQLDFKKLGIFAVVSSLLAGSIAIAMAYRDYGVWSLIAFSVLRPFLNSIMLWLSSNWKPKLEFSKNSFKELFNFGYKLLITNLVNTAYKNVYYFVIGKYFSPTSLGFYTRADQFQTPFSTNITFAIRRISFPILSNYQNDKKNLKIKFIQFIRFSMFLNFIIMLAIAAIAKPLILITIGEKWETSIFYLQLLCIPGMLYPLQILHLNLLLIKGYSNLNLKLEIIKKVILIPIILITVNFGIDYMIYGLIFFSILEYFINSFYTKKIIDYNLKDQFKDFLPFFLISVLTFISMLGVTFTAINLFLMISVQLIIGITVFILANELLKHNEYLTVRNKLLSLLKKYYQ
ncbi:lipopolysaccharide biosynthesis protein [Maribacter stanieri]|uniref:lipopolysaccharide biosynthesis protein n=1 Tax=Maribacter stanieri TaxID=440514 RepID=UPI00249485EF|nr:lipopolysaccharide biosynthesis protein [Maribacter stanieri]